MGKGDAGFGGPAELRCESQGKGGTGNRAMSSCGCSNVLASPA